MQHQAFVDFDAYAESVRDADLRFTLPSLEKRAWSICKINSGRLHIQAGFEGSGNIAEGATRHDGYVLYIQRSGIWALANGVRLCPDCGFVLAPGAEFCIASENAHNWVSVFIPTELLPLKCMEGSERDRARRIRSPIVRKLNEIVDRLIVPTPAQTRMLENPASLRAVESELIRACERLLIDSPDSPFTRQGRPTRSRRDLVAESVALIEESLQDTAAVRDLALAANVSERTLRNVFLEYFGVPPRRYTELRRLHEAYKSLKDADISTATVADVAGSLGFWDYGRFAGKYRQLFGELPGRTLKSRR